MDTKEQSDRPQPPRFQPSRHAWSRVSESDRPAYLEQFKLAVNAWADRLQVARNAIFLAAPEYGKSTHWVRERYYGRAAIALADIDWALSMSRGEPYSDDSHGSQNLHVIRAAVAAYCNTCSLMNNDAKSTKPYCFDGDCELRPASPLPLRYGR